MNDREAGVGDFVLLPTIDMENFLSNLDVRYKAGFIYTYIGEVCVSVKPCKKMVPPFKGISRVRKVNKTNF